MPPKHHRHTQNYTGYTLITPRGIHDDIYEVPALFKILKRAHAINLLAKGEALVGTLGGYRTADLADDFVQDSREGRVAEVFAHGHLDHITNCKEREYLASTHGIPNHPSVLVAHNTFITKMHYDAYAYCLSYQPTRTLVEEFRSTCGYDTVVCIRKPSQLMSLLVMALQRHNVPITDVWAGRCRYRKSMSFDPTRPRDPLMPLWKREDLSRQSEYRLVIGSRNMEHKPMPLIVKMRRPIHNLATIVDPNSLPP